jgi:methylmalonyl-CoA mutase C-terminal domain/subunit
VQEDVDVVAMSILSGAHMHLLPRVVSLLKEEGVYDETLVLGGGVIPQEDIPLLKEQGVQEIFTPGTTTTETIDYIRGNLKRELI